MAEQMTQPGIAEPARALYPALQMIDVTISSSRNTDLIVLEEVNWRVGVGDYWVVGGLQSSGKSDLLNTAAGLLQPLKGTCLVFGKKVEPGFDQELLPFRLRVALVFEGGRLLQHLTVAENVTLPLRYHRTLSLTEALARAEALLDAVDLRRHAESLPGSLSRNWQQRVGLARALALAPEVLLLDNVTAGIDPRESAWWLDMLDQLAAGHPLLDKRPLTIIATTGYLRPWRGRARQFAVLRERRFIPLDRPIDEALAEDSDLRELLGMAAEGRKQ